MSAPFIPMLVDRDSPDAAILTAYEAIRANKAWLYSLEGKEETDELTAEMDRREDAQIADEGIVQKATALTIPGAIATLLEASTHDTDPWYDRALAEYGLMAVFARVDDVDFAQAAILKVARDLIRIDWAQALERYEAANAAFDVVTHIDNLVHEMGLGGAGALTDYLASAETRFGCGSEVNDLIRTLAPDAKAMLLKTEIATREGLAEDALPWIARDATFLLGPVLATQAQSENEGEA